VGFNRKSSAQQFLINRYWRKLSKDLDVDQQDKILPIKIETDKCDNCGSTEVKWKNTLLFIFACDECVPRGCSCRLKKIKERETFFISDYVYEEDSEGNELPCEDWIDFR
jgi:hypothetical protein